MGFLRIQHGYVATIPDVITVYCQTEKAKSLPGPSAERVGARERDYGEADPFGRLHFMGLRHFRLPPYSIPLRKAGPRTSPRHDEPHDAVQEAEDFRREVTCRGEK
jgi:hypothetical protein